MVPVDRDFRTGKPYLARVACRPVSTCKLSPCRLGPVFCSIPPINPFIPFNSEFTSMDSAPSQAEPSNRPIDKQKPGGRRRRMRRKKSMNRKPPTRCKLDLHLTVSSCWDEIGRDVLSGLTCSVSRRPPRQLLLRPQSKLVCSGANHLENFTYPRTPGNCSLLKL